MGSAREAIGIDVGESSAKLVLARRTATGALAIERADLCSLSDEAGLQEGGLDRLTEAFRAIGARPQAVVTCIDRSVATVRTLTVPPASGEELSRIVRYEAESHIPFAIDSAELAHLTLPSANGEARVLITACPRAGVQERRALLKSAGLGATEVSVSTLATLSSLLQIDPALGEQTALIADIGADVTEVTVARHGEPVASFTVAIGGRALTSAVADDLGVELAEAERQKCSRGFALTAPGSSGGPLERVAAWRERLHVGLRRAIESQASANSANPVEAIVLLGGGSLTPGLAEGLAQALLLPVRYADPAGAVGFTPSGGSSVQFATALGLALQGLGLARYEMDLTPREVLERRRARSSQSAWTVAAVAFGLVLALASGFQFARERQSHKRLTAAVAQWEQTAKTAESFKLSEQEAQALQGILANAQDPSNDVLGLLAYLSQRLPAEVRLKDMTFARDDSLVVKGEALDNAAISESQKKLEKDGHFADVVLTHSTAADVDGRTVYGFEIECRLKGGEAE